MASKVLSHRLAYSAFNTALQALAAGHCHRYLHIGHALNESDEAWGIVKSSRRFDDMVDASGDSRFDAMARALRALRDEHEVEYNRATGRDGERLAG